MAKKSMVIKAARKPKYSTRQYNRCQICGRPRGYLRKYKMCRICFRKLAVGDRNECIRSSSRHAHKGS